MHTYTVIGSNRTRSARVLWMLEELGLPFNHISAAPHSSETLAHNPAGKVPVLLVGDTVTTADPTPIADSTAILTWLADHHGRMTAAPGSLQRAAQDSLTQFLLDEIEGPIWMAARHSFVLPPDQRVPEIKPFLKADYATALTRLSARLQGPFLMGSEMTVPDIIATHCLGWAALSKFSEPDTRLAAYTERMTARPAFIRAMSR